MLYKFKQTGRMFLKFRQVFSNPIGYKNWFISMQNLFIQTHRTIQGDFLVLKIPSMQISKLSTHNAGNTEVNFMYMKHFEVQEESIKENNFISNIFIIPKT